MFTGSLHGGRVYPRLAFLIPRQGGAGAVSPTCPRRLYWLLLPFKVNPRTMYDQTGLTPFKTYPLAAGSFGGSSGENPEARMGWPRQGDGRSGNGCALRSFKLQLSARWFNISTTVWLSWNLSDNHQSSPGTACVYLRCVFRIWRTGCLSLCGG